jgi:hypothetical protein
MTTPTPAVPDGQALAREVAAALGAGWHAQRDTDWPDAWALHHQDGRRVRLYGPDFGSDKGRLLLYGLLPDTLPDGERPDRADLDAGSISLAGSSSARRVAMGVTRRLLPKLDTAFAEYGARLAALRAAEQHRVAAAERIAAVPGMSEPLRSLHDRTVTAYHLSWDGVRRGPSHWAQPHARVAVDANRQTAEPHVSVELSGLTPEQAERVLLALIVPSA